MSIIEYIIDLIKGNIANEVNEKIDDLSNLGENIKDAINLDNLDILNRDEDDD